jgi:general secretion pathway protein G
MKYKKSKKAFTMIELVFVIVVIGILAGVAIPRLAATRDDAEITRGMTLLNSVRNALSIERQKRVLRGEFSPIIAVGSGTTVFGHFFDAGGDTNITVLEYPESSKSSKYRWKRIDDTHTYFCLSNSCSGNSDTIRFELSGGRFLCREADASSGKCSMLGVTAEN